MSHFSNLEVIIAGDDRVAYGSKMPPEGNGGGPPGWGWIGAFRRAPANAVLCTITQEQSCPLLLDPTFRSELEFA